MLFYTALFFLMAELLAHCFLSFAALGRGVQLAVDMLLWISAVLFLLCAFLKREFVLYRSGLEVPLLLLIVWMVISFFLPTTQHKLPAFLLSLHWLNCILLFFIAFNLFANYLNPRYIVFALTGVALLLSIYGIAQRHLIYPGIARASEAGLLTIPQDSTKEEFLQRLNAAQPSATFASPNDLGGFLAMFGPLLLLIALKDLKAKKLFRAAANALGFLVLSYCLLLTDSKGGMGALFAASILAVGGYFLWGKRWTLRLWIFGLLAGIALSCLVAFGVFGHFAANAKTMETQSLAQKVERSLLVRLQYWQVAGNIIKEHPLSGVGLTNYADHFTQYKIPEGEETRRVHNNYLEWLVSFGCVGLIVGCVLIVQFFRTAKRNNAPEEGYSSTRDQIIFSLSAGIFTLLMAILAFNAFEFSISRQQTREGWQMGFLLLGMAVWCGFCWWNFKGMEKTRKEHATYFGLLGGLIAFSLHGLLDYGANVPTLMQMFAIFAAALLAHQEPQRLLYWKDFSYLKGFGLLTPFLVFIAILGFYLVPGFMDIDEGLNYGGRNSSGMGIKKSAVADHFKKTGSPSLMRADTGVQRLLAGYYANTWIHENLKPLEKTSSMNFELAVKHFRSAAKLNPLNSHHLYEEGKLHLQRAGLLTAAAMQLTGSDKTLLEKQAEDIIHEKAVPLFEKAIHLYPAKPLYHYFLGKCYELTRKQDQATEFFRQAVELDNRQFHDRLKLSQDQMEETQAFLETR